jgi:predicted lipase
VIVAFRGSACVRDWLTDARIEYADTGLGRVHRGFWESTTSIIDQVRELETPSGSVPLVITGHSKGAAEALICAWLLARMGRAVQSVHTFGGPRIADPIWKRSYQSQTANYHISMEKCTCPTLSDVTYRWVHEEDIVPRMPPWISGRRHVAHECFMSSFGGVELDPPFWRLAASDIWGTFLGYEQGHIDQVADHPVSQYEEHLASL